MRSLVQGIRIAAVASLVVAGVVQAQSGVGVGYSDVGPVVGLGGLNGASLAFGGRYEKVIKPLPDLGDGLLGIQVGADWYSWDWGYAGGTSSVSVIPIGVTANYHFKMENKKVDPFLGAGLGYQIYNASCTYLGVDYCANAWSSGVYFITKAGIRYFTSESMALYADAGVGAAAFDVGVTWKMGGGSNASRSR
jgi:hypothetical protein